MDEHRCNCHNAPPCAHCVECLECHPPESFAWYWKSYAVPQSRIYKSLSTKKWIFCVENSNKSIVFCEPAESFERAWEMADRFYEMGEEFIHVL